MSYFHACALDLSSISSSFPFTSIHEPGIDTTKDLLYLQIENTTLSRNNKRITSQGKPVLKIPSGFRSIETTALRTNSG